MLVGISPRVSDWFCAELFWEVGDGNRWLLISATSGGELENSPGDR